MKPSPQVPYPSPALIKWRWKPILLFCRRKRSWDQQGLVLVYKKAFGKVFVLDIEQIVWPG